jgi:ABC-type phosphate transport system substrate-binding protein
MNRTKPLLIVCLSLLAQELHGSRAMAQGAIVNCADLPNPIYMVGTTAVEPLVKLFGAKLNQLKQTLLWNTNTDGCSSVDTLAFTGRQFVNHSTFQYYQELPVDGGTKIVPQSCNANIQGIGDLAINDIFYSSCQFAYSTIPPKVLPANIKEFLGPVQGLVPIVPISDFFNNDTVAEELLDIYICGANGHIQTFSSNRDIYDYNCQGSGMRELWARSLGVVGGNFTSLIGFGCNSPQSATDVMTTVASDNSGAAIGYTSTEVYDANRDKVKALKVRGVGQKLAYLPDTDLQSLDKINIREGRYTVQGSLKLVTEIDATGVPVNPAAKKVIDWLLDNPITDPSLQLPFSIIDVYAQSGVVPQCAMKVTKDSDAGLFRYYQPERPCHCYFQTRATGKQSIVGCAPCADASTCSAGQICSYGYCENP